MRLLVTGGCGFIGSNFIRYVLEHHSGVEIVNLDKLTYAGSVENTRDLESNPAYSFVQADISDVETIDGILGKRIDAIVNFAAETHVDRSLAGAVRFVRTNMEGTAVLLEAAVRHRVKRFLQVSTDEVYGSLGPIGLFTENSPLRPRNPYAASKAGADHLVRAYQVSWGLDAVITRSSNNYGPFQHPEKFIPHFVTRALEMKPLPLYGDGLQVRDWLHVRDNCRGIWAALMKGKAGKVYNLGGGNERRNIDVARLIITTLGRPESLIQLVRDRPGHDRRYALHCGEARRDLDWFPEISFQEGLTETVLWYRDNIEWVRGVLEREKDLRPQETGS